MGYKGTIKNLWAALGLMFVISLALILGVIPCGLGLIVTIPWSFAVMVKAYEEMFPLPNDQSA